MLPLPAEPCHRLRGYSGTRSRLLAAAQPVDLDELERANRRLAHHLGGDPASTDASRILRPPTSWNRKRTPPTRVELLLLQPARRYPLAQLTAGLTDPSPRRQSPSRPGRVAGSELDQQLLAIPAASYVHALTGRQPNRAGKIHCPFHDDRTPSLQLYDDGTWYCYGACRTGGSVYDFASRWWGLDTRGHQFLALRQRLADELFLDPPRYLGHHRTNYTPPTRPQPRNAPGRQRTPGRSARR